MMRVLGFFGLDGKVENKIAIITKLHCSAESHDGEYSNDFESVPSCTESDFEIVSQIVHGKIEIARAYHENVKIIITVTGELNGSNVNETFHDFESYHQYLQYSLLIDTKAHTDYVTAIKLLQHLKLVDCPSNQDISQEMQRMIKRELLTLPDAIKGLAFYSGIYNPKQRTGEPGIGYRNEALDILKKDIPAIKNVTLAGTKYGFRPA